MSIKNQEKLYYSVSEVATLLGVGQQTIRRIIQRGELKAHRVGHLLRVGKADLDEYLAA